MSHATSTTYAAWQTAYSYYNTSLFRDVLPDCLITLQRKDHRSYGYFSPERFGHMRDDGRWRDEIALNPMKFKSEGVKEALQTLVHEMCHLWQHHYGKPTRGYHNTEWADKMESIGLMPSSTGRPGGARIGARMADYAISGGPFDRSTEALLATGWAIDWYDRLAEMQSAPSTGAMIVTIGEPGSQLPRPNRTNRVRYDCPSCNARAWGRPGLAILCGVHNKPMQLSGA